MSRPNMDDTSSPVTRQRASAPTTQEAARPDSCRAPRIAVVLPVFNGERYITEAVESVLRQTFTDYELIVVNDGSTDRTAELLARFSDPRMRVVSFPDNRGLVSALNTGIAESRAELIARMDADDICLPQRFQMQVKFLDEHPEVGICGTWTRGFGTENSRMEPPADPAGVAARIFFGWTIDHPSVMMRRSVLDRHGLRYRDEFRHVEDFDLFTRAAEITQVANVAVCLLLTRAHAEEISVVHRQEQVSTERRIMVRQLATLIPNATEADKELHLKIAYGSLGRSRFHQAERWLLRLQQANCERQRYNQQAFDNELRWRWFLLHANAGPGGYGVVKSYRSLPLAADAKLSMRDYARLLAGPRLWFLLHRLRSLVPLSG